MGGHHYIMTEGVFPCIPIHQPFDVVIDGRYHLIGVVHQRRLVHVHHQRHGRPEDVRIEQSDAMAELGQRDGQVTCLCKAKY